MNSIATHGLKKYAITGLLILFPSACAEIALSKNLGQFGLTYPIKEPDALTEIEEKAKKVDWTEVFSEKKMKTLVEEYKPEGLVALPRASHSRRYQVDLTYTVKDDILDGKGNLVYPRGYAFNPLDFVSFPNTLVVLDGDDPTQLEWFTASNYLKDVKVTLLITNGSYSKISLRLDRPVYYLNQQIMDRFKLKAVPVVIQQAGRFMEIEEVVVKNHP